MRALSLACALGVALLVAAPTSATVQTSGVPIAGAGEKDMWVDMIRQASDELGAARARYEKAREDYSRMRSRRKARGAGKEAVMQARDQAALDLAEAERRLKELLESARRSGVPPGWVREALDPPPAAGDF
jgi:uncharacterized protein (DUF3084 family)